MALALLALLVGGCGSRGSGQGMTDPEVTEEEAGHGDPGESLESEAVAEVPPGPLSLAEMERYYAAQIDWRTCAVNEGFPLPDPPALEEFVAGGGSWWVGDDLSDDEWNRMVGDESGATSMDAVCGEPPLPADFRVD